MSYEAETKSASPRRFTTQIASSPYSLSLAFRNAAHVRRQAIFHTSTLLKNRLLYITVFYDASKPNCSADVQCIRRKVLINWGTGSYSDSHYSDKSYITVYASSCGNNVTVFSTVAKMQFIPIPNPITNPNPIPNQICRLLKVLK